MKRWANLAASCLVAVALLVAAGVPAARADGDPGSDVLVFQNLFAGSDAGLSVAQQIELGRVLSAAAKDGFPIRVAIIAGKADLGAVTGLWGDPRGYARFLGIELSLAYTQRLLVVMPSGFGFNWPGHSTAAAYRVLGGVGVRGGLFAATMTALDRLAAASGVRLPGTVSAAGAATTPARATATPSSPSAPAATGSSPGSGTDALVGIIVLGLAALAIAAFVLRRTIAPRLRLPLGGARAHRRRVAIPSFALLLVLAIAVVIAARANAPAGSQADALAQNPYLDPGTTLTTMAPDFTLTDQFGSPVSLHSFRGKVVLIAFNDSECTTLCPLTTTAMLDAKAMLGRAGSQVELLGVDANPAALSLEDVWSYSELHGMLHAWHFLTGSLTQLQTVWKDYNVEAAVDAGEITHTPALFVVSPQGREAKVYMTQMSYSAIGQLGQLLAQEASSLLPSHPAVHSGLSYARIAPTLPTQTASLPRLGGGSVSLGPGHTARLYMFFATWDQETSGLGGQLDALNRYQAIATREGLPPLTAVDEASVEPGASTLSQFVRSLPQPLSYPVAVDRSGTVGDGYEVLGLPWFVLISPSGQFLYYRYVSTAGWPSTATLVNIVRAALTRVPTVGSAAAARRDLAGSPPPLAALHSQASQLLGGQPALMARLRALRGYPVVINVWASWCVPCRSEFGLFASASARYGTRVAFLGADTDDSAGDARAFLGQHAVSYPSYQTTTSNLSPLAVIGALPTTIYIDPAGKVVNVHIGQYDSEGTLDQDVEDYALQGS